MASEKVMSAQVVTLHTKTKLKGEHHKMGKYVEQV